MIPRPDDTKMFGTLVLIIVKKRKVQDNQKTVVMQIHHTHRKK